MPRARSRRVTVEVMVVALLFSSVERGREKEGWPPTTFPLFPFGISFSILYCILYTSLYIIAVVKRGGERRTREEGEREGGEKGRRRGREERRKGRAAVHTFQFLKHRF